jgi:hypothetical protein
MADDNNVTVERLDLLDQLADKQREMRSKKIALTPVEQAMLSSILELPPGRQVVTQLRRFIQRMERTLSEFESEMSVQTVPAAQTVTTSAYPSSGTSEGPSHSKALERRQQEEDSEHPENVGAAGARRSPRDSLWIFRPSATAPHSWFVAWSQRVQACPAPRLPRGGFPSSTHRGGERAIP